MSTEIGNGFNNLNRESCESSVGNGSNNAENGDSGVTRDTPSIADFGSYATFNPASEPINRGTTSSPGGEPRRTKSGKLDRRTKAGRTETETPRTVNSAPKKLISLEKAILSLHDMAASIFEIEEIMLSEDEAKALSDAVMDVSQYYVSSFDPKKVAIFNLVTCCGGIYATRIMAYRHRMEVKRRGKLVSMPEAPQANSQPIQPLQPDPSIILNPPIIGAAGY